MHLPEYFRNVLIRASLRSRNCQMSLLAIRFYVDQLEGFVFDDHDDVQLTNNITGIINIKT